MASYFRLRGRALQMGNGTVFFLIFFTALLIVITSNLLPVIFIRGISIYIGELSAQYSGILNLFVSAALLTVIFTLYCSVTLGIKRYLFKKAQKKTAHSEDIFYYFRPKNFFICMWYSVRIKLLRLSILLFCLFPCFACLFLVYRLSSMGVSALVCMSMTFTALLLFINGMLFYQSFSSSFFLCDYYFACGEYLNFRHLVASSQERMKNKRKTLLRLRMSFSGWFLLCLLIFPLPFVWSYYSQSLAVAADDFMK